MAYETREGANHRRKYITGAQHFSRNSFAHFARTTALNGDFNSIYLRGIARTTRVRRTCIYRCGERVLVLKYPWPFCLSTLLLFMYARTPLRKPDLSSAALRFLRIIERSMTFAFRGIYVLHWNFGNWNGDICIYIWRWYIAKLVQACTWFGCWSDYLWDLIHGGNILFCNNVFSILFYRRLVDDLFILKGRGGGSACFEKFRNSIEELMVL